MSLENESIPSDGGSAVTATETTQQSTDLYEGTGSGNAASSSSSAATAAAAGNQPTQPAAASQPQAAASDWVSIREAAYNQYGLDLRNLPDDQTALRTLIGQAAQAQQAQQIANRYLQHSGQFEQWLQSQQQQKPAAPSYWNPPEWNANWRQMVSRDPQTGEYKVAAGAPADILPKFLAFENYRREFADKLTTNPIETLKPMIEDVARQIAQAQVQQHLGSYQDQVYADGFVNQNSSWLHQRDQTGRVVTDPMTQRPMLSPAGARFRQHVETLHNAGVTDLRTQEQMARQFTERDLAMAQLQQLQAGQQNGAIKQQFLQQNNTRTPNQSGALPPSAAGTAGLPNTKLSLAERLKQRFAEAGIDDAALAEKPSGPARG